MRVTDVILLILSKIPSNIAPTDLRKPGVLRASVVNFRSLPAFLTQTRESGDDLSRWESLETQSISPVPHLLKRLPSACR